MSIVFPEETSPLNLNFSFLILIIPLLKKGSVDPVEIGIISLFTSDCTVAFEFKTFGNSFIDRFS